MIYISSLHDLILIVPDLISLFLPGFICVYMYNYFYDKQANLSMMCLWGLFISYLIKIIYTTLHYHILTNISFNESTKSIIYIITGVIISCIIIPIRRSNCFRKFMLNINHQTGNKDIFDDLIDYDNALLMHIYPKQSDVYYIGTFSLKGEGDYSTYITLINYIIVDYKTNKQISEAVDRTTIVFNLQDIEQIEITYSDKSKIWQRLQAGNQDDSKVKNN